MSKSVRIISLLLSLVMLVSAMFSIPVTSFAASTNYFKGVDVSEHNGTVDFVSLKAQGYDFAMIRIGYIASNTDIYDKYFYQNVKAACDAGMFFGLYFYSYAFDEAEAAQEADFTLRAIKTLDSQYLQKMTLPVAYDVEDKLISNNCTKTQITANTLYYCDLIKNAGYTPMVYSNLNWFNNYVDVNQVNAKGIKIWYANWVSNPDFSAVKSVGTTSVASYMWQYTSGSSEADGLDKNILYSALPLSTITLSANSYTYDGTAKKPAVTVKMGTATLKNGTDYTVSYSNNTNAGTATVTVTGKGNYSGTAKKTFTIKQKSISSTVKVSLSATSYTYSGSARKPSVTVKDSAGKTISASNYSVTYSNNTKVGTATAKVTFKGNYSGSISKTFKILPKNTSISSVTSQYKGFTVKLKKYTTQTTGYQIQYSTSSKFTSAKTVAINNATTSKTVTGLTAKKKYYVRVRTYTKVGSTYYYSAWSGAKSVTTSSYPTTITLSTTSYTYNGKVRKPTVTVKNNGKTVSSKYYTVTYPKGRKNVGTYTVTIKFKKPYSGTVKKTFTIKPKNTSISSVTANSKGFTVKLKKYTTQTTGYQIQYSTTSNFSKYKTVTLKNTTTSKKITGLTGKKKYYVRVRTYKKVSGKYYYSAWSKAKAVTTKK